MEIFLIVIVFILLVVNLIQMNKNSKLKLYKEEKFKEDFLISQQIETLSENTIYEPYRDKGEKVRYRVFLSLGAETTEIIGASAHGYPDIITLNKDAISSAVCILKTMKPELLVGNHLTFDDE